MAIWKKPVDKKAIQALLSNYAHAYMNIEFVNLGDDYLALGMKIDENFWNPFGTLHGGVSALLAESAGNSAAECAVDYEHHCVCIDMNINHLKSLKKGFIVATAKPIQLGNSLQVWHVDIVDEGERKIAVARLTFYVLGQIRGES